jgi:hypothetical protein
MAYEVDILVIQLYRRAALYTLRSWETCLQTNGIQMIRLPG